MRNGEGIIMESSEFRVMVLIIIICHLAACATDCIWFLVFGIVFLILMSVVLFVVGYFSKDTVILLVMVMIIYLVCIFVCIWVFDEWDVLYLEWA